MPQYAVSKKVGYLHYHLRHHRHRPLRSHHRSLRLLPDCFGSTFQQLELLLVRLALCKERGAEEVGRHRELFDELLLEQLLVVFLHNDLVDVAAFVGNRAPLGVGPTS